MKEILNIKLKGTDIGNTTIGSYLCALLTELWVQEEGFSGKRPFGNSGWTRDIYKGLIKHKVIRGKLDSDGCIGSFDEKAGERIIKKLIKQVFANASLPEPTPPAQDLPGEV